jgi:glutaredoxin
MQSRLIAGALLVAALAAAFAAQSATNVYRWVDQNGKVHFSDTPPPEEAKDVSQKSMGGSYIEESNLPYATQIAMKKNPVTLYTANDCGDPCNQGRELLSTRGVPFTEHNARGSNADMDALKKLAGALDVPFLMVGENKIHGYDADTWNSALDGAGYPRTRLPGQPATAAAPKAPPGPAPAR